MSSEESQQSTAYVCLCCSNRTRCSRRNFNKRNTSNIKCDDINVTTQLSVKVVEALPGNGFNDLTLEVKLPAKNSRSHPFCAAAVFENATSTAALTAIAAS